MDSYKQEAIIIIRNYLNRQELKDQEIIDLYSIAVDKLANIIAKTTDYNIGIKSVTQGSRSITYADNLANNYINYVKLLLPPPYIRC